MTITKIEAEYRDGLWTVRSPEIDNVSPVVYYGLADSIEKAVEDFIETALNHGDKFA